jgi:hypothetical protein
MEASDMSQWRVYSLRSLAGLNGAAERTMKAHKVVLVWSEGKVFANFNLVVQN